jgi:broad specificity phosphatase PhoE
MPPTTILIRHADAPRGENPSLTAGGIARAQELTRVLGDAHIDAIYVSERKRTLETAAPLAAKLQLVPRQSDDVAGVVAEIRARPTTDVVLVVGHTTTLDDFSAGLGGPPLPTIAPDEFDHLFVHTVKRVAHLRYGPRPD